MGFKISKLLIIRSSFANLAMPLIKEYIGACRLETDCLSLDLYGLDTEQKIFVLEGTWKNGIAYLYHTDQPHYSRFLHDISGMQICIKELRDARSLEI